MTVFRPPPLRNLDRFDLMETCNIAVRDPTVISATRSPLFNNHPMQKSLGPYLICCHVDIWMSIALKSNPERPHDGV